MEVPEFKIDITDGSDTISYYAATFRRTLDFGKNYQFQDLPGHTDPIAIEFLMIRDIIELQDVWYERRTDYDDLITMLKSHPAGTEFTITVERKTGSNESFTVVPQRFIDQRDPGSGEMDNLTMAYTVVKRVDAGT